MSSLSCTSRPWPNALSSGNPSFTIWNTAGHSNRSGAILSLTFHCPEQVLSLIFMSLDIKFSPLPGKSSQSFLNDNASHHSPQLPILQVNFPNICKVHLLHRNCFQQQQISVPMSWSRSDTLLGTFASCNAGTNDRRAPSDLWKNILVLEEGNTDFTWF